MAIKNSITLPKKLRTFAGSSPDNLYLIGLDANDNYCKIKVNKLGCHGGINGDSGNTGIPDSGEGLPGVDENTNSWKYELVKKLPAIFESNTIYILYTNGVYKQYALIDGEQKQLAGALEGEIISGNKDDEDGIGLIDETDILYNIHDLVNGSYRYKNNKTLSEVSSDFSALEIGTQMFFGCTNLTSFIGELSSLEVADGMFAKCLLDESSLIYIADSIKNLIIGKNNHTNKTNFGHIDIGYEVTENSDEIINEIELKGWTVKKWPNGTLLK